MMGVTFPATIHPCWCLAFTETQLFWISTLLSVSHLVIAKQQVKNSLLGVFPNSENLDMFGSNVISNESMQINTSLQQKDLFLRMWVDFRNEDFDSKSHSFQADYKKLVQNGHLLLLGIESTLYLFYVRPGQMLAPSWRHTAAKEEEKKSLKLSEGEKLTVLFLPRILGWLQVIPCFPLSCSLECLPGWSRYMQEERQSA